MLRYTVKASIDPGEQVLDADVIVKIQPEAGSRSLKFCLHRDLALETVEGKNVSGVTYGDPQFQFAPEAITINVAIGTFEGLEQEIRFKYRGRLGITSSWEVNRVSPQWIELGLYTPWFPLALPMQNAEFSIQMTLPPEYTLISSGDTKQGWFVSQNFASTDCTLVAAPNFLVKHAEKDGSIVTASYTESRSQPDAAFFSSVGAEVLNWFTRTLGDIGADRVDIVIAPRIKGGGYARRGFIMFTSDSNLDDKPKVYRYIAHEFAHLWWYRADVTTWEDWLNESLAEFSALLVIRQLLGLETYTRMLEVRKNKAQNLPPIAGISRDSADAHTVLYFKGAVLLAELEAEIGEESFLGFLQELVRLETRTTAGFMEVLTRIAGEETAAAFAVKLKNR